MADPKYLTQLFGDVQIGDVSPDYVHAPNANTAAVVTLPATAGKRWKILGLIVSYNATPTNGAFQIENGAGSVVCGPHYVTTSGPAPQAIGQRYSVNTAIVVTVAAGGESVKGSLTVVPRLED
jgi:hypothetical protein